MSSAPAGRFADLGAAGLGLGGIGRGKIGKRDFMLDARRVHAPVAKCRGGVLGRRRGLRQRAGAGEERAKNGCGFDHGHAPLAFKSTLAIELNARPGERKIKVRRGLRGFLQMRFDEPERLVERAGIVDEDVRGVGVAGVLGLIDRLAHQDSRRSHSVR